MFCITCALRKLYSTQQINPEQQTPCHGTYDLTSELMDLHRFSFNSLMTLLAVLSLSGSKTLAPVVLALLIFTISLRLAVNPCFIQNYPILARFLHVVPLLGTFCMACIELAIDMRSPALAVVILLSSVLPFVLTTFHLGNLHPGKNCEEMPLHIRMQEPPPTVLGHSGAPVMSS